MKESQAISCFGALAQETRLSILRRLVKAGEAGLASGNLAESVGVSPATMSFHLGQLEASSLVSSRRVSRRIIYSANYDQLGALLSFIMKDCCANDPRVKNCC
jgi:ArsR family transcriptional regulator, arsenate/arsenite/antimonite-responsive transcriptional repressor